MATWTRSDVAGLSRHDERWPLVAALVWIATRSRRYVEAFSAREPGEIDALLHPERTQGGLPPGLTLAEAFYEIDRKIAMGRLRGRARKLKWTIPPEEEMATPERYSALTRPPEVIEAGEFLPQELRNAMIGGEPPLRWSDFVFHDGDSLTPKGSGYGSPNADGSRARWSWQAVSFDREDLLRLWPDPPCVTAWLNAIAIPWRPTAPKYGADAEIVGGRRFIPLPEVVALVAFGPNLQPLGHDATEAMAMRFRACRLVVDAAASGRLGFIGRAAFRMRNFPGGLGPATALYELDSAALVDLGRRVR